MATGIRVMVTAAADAYLPQRISPEEVAAFAADPGNCAYFDDILSRATQPKA